MDHGDRKMIHIGMHTFDASVEQRDDPSLRGKRWRLAAPANAVSWPLQATKRRLEDYARLSEHFPDWHLGCVTELCDAEIEQGCCEVGEAAEAEVCFVTPQCEAGIIFQAV